MKKIIKSFISSVGIIFCVLMFSFKGIAQIQNSAIRMDMEWLSSTANTADFQIRLTNTGPTAVKFNALIVRGVHAANLTTGTITFKALNDNTLPGWLAWPQTGTNNLPYIEGQRKLNFSSSTGIFTSATAQAIPSGSGVVMGTFRMSTTTSWALNSDFGFVWEMTSGGVVAYVDGAATVTNIQHFGTVNNATTCASCLTVTASSAQPLNPTTSSTLNITMFIQGYYAGNNAMTPVLANQAEGTSTTSVDTVLVQLIDPTSLLVVASAQGVLQTNGTAACTFSTAQSGLYYIAVKHRNALETWSADPVLIGASSSYNFTALANKAYGDNMIEVESGVWAFYSGDLNQDGFIEGSDFPLLFNSNDDFEEGYKITDLNGDGFVEGSDYPILSNNSDNFIESMRPY